MPRRQALMVLGLALVMGLIAGMVAAFAIVGIARA